MHREQEKEKEGGRERGREGERSSLKLEEKSQKQIMQEKTDHEMVDIRLGKRQK